MSLSSKASKGKAYYAQSGFTLVELMIALVIGLIVVVAASQAYLTSMTSFSQVKNLLSRHTELNALTSVFYEDVRRSSGVSDYSGQLGIDDEFVGGEYLTAIEFVFPDGYKDQHICPGVSNAVNSKRYYLFDDGGGEAQLCSWANCKDSGLTAGGVDCSGVDERAIMTGFVSTDSLRFNILNDFVGAVQIEAELMAPSGGDDYEIVFTVASRYRAIAQ